MTDQTELFGTETSQVGSQTFHNHVFLRKDAPQTSREAAHDVLPKTGSQQRSVYNFIHAQAQYGATDSEIELSLGLNASSVRPRRIELRDAKLVHDSGKRRKTRSGSAAIVWIATNLDG